MRADKLMDDRPALADMGVHDPDYVARCATGWKQDIKYTWAVSEPTTGELVAEVTLMPSTGTIGIRARPGHDGAAAAAAAAVRRFAAALPRGVAQTPEESL